MQVQKIVSGGQTGVDRTALDVAIYLEIPHGGWCPRGRTAEDGMIPVVYQLTEADSPDYVVRTERNVMDSDGTLILYQHKMTGGTKLTARFARRHGRPLLAVDLSQDDVAAQCDAVHKWLGENSICTLNIAGPRASSCPDIRGKTESFLLMVLDSARN